MVISTESREEPKRRAKELGVLAWVIKPFGPEALLRLLPKLAPKRSGG